MINTSKILEDRSKQLAKTNLILDRQGQAPYFEWIYDCVQFVDDRRTSYKSAQFIHKAHHVVLKSEFYVDSCKERSKNPVSEQMMIGFKNIFAE